MMEHYCQAGEEGFIQAASGIRRKTLIYGSHTLMVQFNLDSDAILPMHRHPEEQTGYLVSGHMTLTIGGIAYDIRPGDSWMIPGDVEHGAVILKDTVAVEVFSPVRMDYLPERA